MNLLRSLFALPLFLLPAIFGLPNSWGGLACGLLVWMCINDANFILHQHVHRPLTRVRPLNKVIDLLLSLTTGMSAYSWRQHHLLRHHRGDDSWRHARPWELRRPSFLGALWYSLRYGVLLLVLPLWEAFLRGVLCGHKHPLNFRMAFLEQSVVLLFAGVLIAAEPAFYGPCFFLVFFLTALTDYQNHVGCDSSKLEVSNNIVRAAYNRVRDNFGYHTAHHHFPGAHWTELPALHARIAGALPAARVGRGWWIGQVSAPLIILALSGFLGRRSGRSVV